MISHPFEFFLMFILLTPRLLRIDVQVSDALFAYNAGMVEPMNWMFSENVR